MADSSNAPIDPAVAIITGSVRRALHQPAPIPPPQQVSELGPRIASLARFHRLAGCLVADPFIGPHLQQKSTDTSRDRTIGLLLEIGRVLGRLEQAGVPAIPLKGPLLAGRLFGNPTFRGAHDIDLLIRLEHMDRAQSALEPEYRPDPRVRREMIGTENHEQLKPVAGGRMVELHWRVLHPMSGALIPDNAPWVNPTIHETAGIRHQRLDPAVEIVVVCAHAAHHFGFRLHWMSDVAALLLKTEPEVWQSALEIAASWGVKRAMLTAADAAIRVFGLSPESQVLREIDRFANHAVADWIHRRVAGGAMSGPGQFSTWPRRLGLFDSRRQMVKATANLLFTPLPEDRAASHLPSWADPVTALIRPFLILQRAIVKHRS